MCLCSDPLKEKHYVISKWKRAGLLHLSTYRKIFLTVGYEEKEKVEVALCCSAAGIVVTVFPPPLTTTTTTPFHHIQQGAKYVVSQAVDEIQYFYRGIFDALTGMCSASLFP